MPSRERSVKKSYIAAAVLLALLPVAACFLRLLFDGHFPGDIWPVGSTWNDEVMYYKQVESIVKHDIPHGYFGYNESAAEHLTFGAWTPTILLPFALWGKVFGWSFVSPIYCNVVILGLSLAIFAALVKPGLKEACVAFLGLLAFVPLSRYIFSYMPEISVIAALIILFGLYISVCRKWSYIKEIFIYLILFSCVIIRPYFAVLFVLPIILAFKRQGKERLLNLLGVAMILSVSLAVYSYLRSKFTAEYYEAVYAGFFDKIFTHGPRLVIKEALGSLQYNGFMVFLYIKNAFTGSDAIGAYYASFLFFTILLLVGAIICAIRKNVEKAATYGLLFVGQVLVFLSILVMYNVFDGYRHIICFIVADLLFIVFYADVSPAYRCVSAAIGVGLFVFFFLVRSDCPEYYDIPYRHSDDPLRVSFASDKEITEKKMNLSLGISFENTVDILIESGAEIEAAYLVPAGFGISMCEKEYLTLHIGELKSRYLILPRNDDIYEQALLEGWQEKFTNDRLVLLSR